MFGLHVLYEDNHLLVVIKPANVLSQGDQTGDDCIVDWAKAYIKEKYQKPGDVFLGLPHRLDRPVEGLMVLARTSKALTRLNEQFHKREVQKTYLALVEGKPIKPKGLLEHFLLKDPKTNITQAFDQEQAQSKAALLRYEWVLSQGHTSLLRVLPETGRPHQIRVQLAAMGCPIVGDVKYGAKPKRGISGIGLYAYALELLHPVKKEPMRFQAPWPKWLRDYGQV